MRICLEVLASAGIKRKKPWPKISWLGIESESLFLLDDKRISVLYVPSGKTKRTIPKVSSLLPETACLSISPGGSHLVGIQTSGDVFIWHKDKDDLKTICGLAHTLLNAGISPSDGCCIFASHDCSKILLVLGNSHVYLWLSAPGDSRDNRNNTILGKWFNVSVPSRIHLPTEDHRETAMHAVFTNSEIYGDCCHLSIIWNQRSSLNITSLLIRFTSTLENVKSSDVQSLSNDSVRWASLLHPLANIQQGCEPINMPGAYTCSYTNDGCILAVGVNQKCPAQTSMLFVSPLTETLLVSSMRGCGVKDPSSKRGKQYWIADMVWTYDNLFLVTILKNGTVGLMSRLGEPLVLTSRGCSVDLGPAYFLPLTPLISVQSDGRHTLKERADTTLSFNSEVDPFRQLFSVTTHPSLPIILVSDGYLAVILQLPSDIGQLTLMRDLVLESSSNLRQVAETNRLDLTLANAYNLPASDLEGIKDFPHGNGHHHHHIHRQRESNKFGASSQYRFEEPSISLNETIDSEVSLVLGADEQLSSKATSNRNQWNGPQHNLSSGKVMFGEPELLHVTEDSTQLNFKEPNSTIRALQLAKANLVSVWKLAGSTTELWSSSLDKILTHTVHNMVKLFTLLLDCPQVRDLLDDPEQTRGLPQEVHTASLFKVITMYRQVLDLLQLDCHQRHLVAAALHLCHRTTTAILASPGLRNCDPRIKTLTGCLTLLKFTEKSLTQAYVATPAKLRSKGLLAASSDARAPDADALYHDGGEGAMTGAQLAKRLTATWQLLYKSVVQFASSTEISAADSRQGQVLQTAIHQCLLELDAEIPLNRPVTQAMSNGEIFSMDGKHTMAMNAWKQQLSRYKELGNVKNASRLFHSLLYTYILRNDLTAAIAFVDSLIVRAESHLEEDINPDTLTSTKELQPSLMTFVTRTLKSQAFQEPDMVPCIRDRAIRQMVQSMARFMVAYFSNQTVFIFPPHNPVPLPAVHFETSITYSRIIPKYHEDVASSVRHQQLGQVWTLERALEYLLLSGLVCEAAWLAHRVGDWKAAYQLSVAHTLHRKLAPAVYRGSKKPLSLPQWLTPDAIMKGRLEKLVQNDLQLSTTSSDQTQLIKTLEDIALAGVMGYVEIGSWLLAELVSKLKNLVSQMTPLVTKDFYLPAPPLYCPQPSVSSKLRLSIEAEDETKLRQRASSIIQLALCVMNASHLSVPAAAWYTRVLAGIQHKATQFKITTEGPCLELPDVLFTYLDMEEGDGEFPEDSDDPSVCTVQSNFRDLCSLLWLLHARDKLSLCVRSREKFLSLGLDVEHNEQWLKECFLTLQWAVHMVAFSRYLSDEASIYKVMLSVILDLPSTEDVANIVAEHMYSLDNLHPEVQDRLERMLQSWQSIIIRPEADGRSVGDSLDMDEEGRKSVTFLGASPRGKSLSIYFHKQCAAADKTVKRKSQCYGYYEEFVFSNASATTKAKHNGLYIGSRPFETKRSFLEFLDTFYSVAFSKVLEVMAHKDKTSAQPFLRCFAKDIVDREMMFFVQRVASSAHKKMPSKGLSVIAGGQEFQGSSWAGGQYRKSRGHSVPGRTSARTNSRERQGEGVANTETRAREVSSKPVGLFRGKSMVEASLERSHACVKSYSSEPAHLDDPDLQSEPSSYPGPQDSHQSEGGLYGSQKGEQSGWSLTVNFGRKYTALQQLVEWLEVWGSKSHTLGLEAGQEELLHNGSQLKIQIPAQLIVLSLWLLEHKYQSQCSGTRSRSNTRKDKARQPSRGQRAHRLSKSPHRSMSPAGSVRSTRSRSGTPPIYPENSLKLHQSAPRRSQLLNSPTQQAVGSRHSSPATPPPGPAQASTLEEEQIIDAYTQVLDGPEDSSSIGVSSLASDELDEELKNTLNVIKSTAGSPGKENSALNQVIFPKDESPERGAPRPQNSSTPKQGQRTPSISPPRVVQQRDKSGSEHISRSEMKHLQNQSDGQQHRQRSQTQQAVGGDLASQLQNIIRDELRRIMEVQHRSVLAMMGALDQVGADQIPLGPTPQPTHQMRKASSVSQRGKSPRHQRSQDHTGAPGPDDTHNLEDESVAEMVSLKEEIVQSQAPVRVQMSPKDGQHQVRGALSELHNLQAKVAQPTTRQASYAEEISSRASRILSHQPGHPSLNGSAHLPLLAWSDSPSQQQHKVPPPGPFPLLHLPNTQDFSAQDPFRNIRRFLPRVPPPQVSPHPQSNFSSSGPPSFPQQQAFPSYPGSLQAYNIQQTYPPPPHDFPQTASGGFPLLSAAPSHYNNQYAPGPAINGSTWPFPLLRFTPPGSSEQEQQRTKVEEVRQRLLQKFQQHVLQDKENQDQAAAASLTHRMLHLEPQAELPLSARSEPSRASERLPSEREISKHEMVGEPERAPSAQSEATAVLDTSLTEGGHTGSAAEAPINDGYALPQGIFESYLQLGEHLIGPEAGQTSAAFQLKMAQAMQRQAEKRIKSKVDFSTMTREQVDAAIDPDPAMENVRTAEAATSITRDTGVDPIEEAVRDYNIKRQNNIVPPDIFMGLRFADQDGQAGVASGAPSDEPSRGRSYLNVADIRASAVLRDIPEKAERGHETEKDEEHQAADLGSAMLASQRTLLQMGAIEEKFREKLAPQRSTGAALGHDSLTVRMFDQLQPGQHERMSVAVMPRSSVSEPKAAMLRRLQDMSDQIRAIDDMSQNIEREFKSSHLLLNTIQDVNASIQRSRSPSPDRSKVIPARPHKELRYSFEVKSNDFDQHEDYYQDEEEEASSVRTLTPHLPTPKSSTKSPQASARSARSKSSFTSNNASEITELLSEVLAEQGVDMQSAGYPKELAQQLERDAREHVAKQKILTPRNVLEGMKQAEERAAERQAREQKEELKKWMAAKFHKRHEEYRKRRQELIEKEPKPFKSFTPTSKVNLHKLSEERSERRQHMAADFMTQRLTEAEHLMGSIIVDRPEMPTWGALATGEGLHAHQSASQSTITGRGTQRKSRSPSRKSGLSSHRLAFSSRSPSDVRISREVTPTVKGILKPSATSTTLTVDPTRLSNSDLYLDQQLRRSSDLNFEGQAQYSNDLHLGNFASLSGEHLSVDSSADIINYARRILQVEEAAENVTPGDSYEMHANQIPIRREPIRSLGRQPHVKAKAKGKSFEDMVRLQRPAVTRKWENVNKQRQAQAAAAATAAQERFAQAAAGQKTWTVKDPNLVNGQPKEYGSKKIPGSSPRGKVSSARRVKTYAERLQEMKPSSKTYSPPASRGMPASARTMSSAATRRSGQRGPPHKPQTYVQQLKSISSRASARGGAASQGKLPVKMRTFLRSHGPVHQPKTYTEQLKELNPHPQPDMNRTRMRSMTASGAASSVGVGSRSVSRHRPYGDPYSEMDYEELASVLSDWDMDENVRNIIYGGSTAASSVAFRGDGDLSLSGGDMMRAGVAPSEAQSDYFDVVMQGDGPYRSLEEDEFQSGIGDYRTSVDVHEIERIADAASVGSGSVLSVIDWDAVNDLIKDV